MSQNDQTLTYDDGDTDEPLYNYGRDFVKGGQQGFILVAKSKTWDDGGRQVDLVIGTGCPSMPGKGVKSDFRLRIPSPEYGEFLRIMGVTPVKGQPIDLGAFKNRELWVTIGEEIDRKKSEELRRNVMRAKCLAIAAPRPKDAPPPAAPAAQAQPKPPAFA